MDNGEIALVVSKVMESLSPKITLDIAKALSPAKVLKVSANEGELVARVVVPDDKLSLAIGKNGQNARLASQATGWKIDIKDESSAYNEGIRFKPNVY